jgi:hypothetical protein
VVDIIVFVVLETASTQPKKRDVTGNIRSRSQKQEMAKKGKNKRLLYKLQGLDRSSDRDVLENRGGKFELSVVRSRFFSERERELRSARVSIRRILCMSSLSLLFASHVRSKNPHLSLSRESRCRCSAGLQTHREPLPLLWASHHARRYAGRSLLCGIGVAHTAALRTHGSLH